MTKRKTNVFSGQRNVHTNTATQLLVVEFVLNDPLKLCNKNSSSRRKLVLTKCQVISTSMQARYVFCNKQNSSCFAYVY